MSNEYDPILKLDPQKFIQRRTDQTRTPTEIYSREACISSLHQGVRRQRKKFGLRLQDLK